MTPDPRFLSAWLWLQAVRIYAHGRVLLAPVLYCWTHRRLHVPGKPWACVLVERRLTRAELRAARQRIRHSGIPKVCIIWIDRRAN